MPSRLWATLRRLSKMALIKKEAPAKEAVPPMEERTVSYVFGHIIPKATSAESVPPISTTYPDLLCGVELEIENLHDGHGWYSERVGEFWMVEEDGSLRPRGASWEFISRPSKLGQALAETGHLFNVLGVTEGRNYSDRCSVHIHCNVIDWTQAQIAGLAVIYPVFEEVLFKYINHHKKKEEQGYCRDTNLYCIPWSACRHNRNFVENLFTNPANMKNWQKYTALNLLPIIDKGTVEWRHMHGTCDMEKLTTWFNIIGAIMKYCRVTPFQQIVDILQKMNDVSAYQQWFEEVLQGQLPYDEEYRRLMAEGVLNAKYSIINLEANKGKSGKQKLGAQWGFDAPLGFGDGFLDDLTEDDPRPVQAAAQQLEGAAAAVQRLRRATATMQPTWGDLVRTPPNLINPVNPVNNPALNTGRNPRRR
jgi:hypothetical protein